MMNDYLLDIEAVIFDLDDTLYMERDFVFSGFSAVAADISDKSRIYKEKIYDSLVDTFNKDKRNVFDRTLTKLEIDFSKDYIKKLVNIYRYHIPNITACHETKAVLGKLKNKGIKLGIITDGYVKMQNNKINALGIRAFFDSIVISDAFGIEYRKPHPKPYQYCVEELRVAFDKAVYIGDNPKKDFVTANKLGIKTIQIIRNEGIYAGEFMPEQFRAQEIIFDFSELII